MSEMLPVHAQQHTRWAGGSVAALVRKTTGTGSKPGRLLSHPAALQAGTRHPRTGVFAAR